MSLKSLRLGPNPVSLRPPKQPVDREERRLTAVFLAPALIVTFGVILFPLVEALWVSLHQYTLTIPGRPWIGLANYLEALLDPTFWAAIGRTFYFTLVSTGLELVLGMLIALLLNERFVGQGLLRGILLIPWALPTVVSGMMWRWIDNADYGALNGLLVQVGLLDKYRAWLSSPWSAMNMVIVADVWKMAPLVALLLLANLSTIPAELYEAAAIDGAGAVKRFWNVTVPCIRAGILVSLVLRTIEAFKVFDLIFIMTRSGPANGTQTVAYYAYTEAFTSLQFGKGAALSYLIGIAIVLLSVLYFRLIREDAAA